MNPNDFLVDPEELAQRAIAEDLNPRALDIDTTFFKRAPSSIAWAHDQEFAGTRPYPRQIEAMVNFFGDFCPYCSDKDTLANMWGMNLDQIKSKVSILHNGVCPVCSKTKVDFRNEQDEVRKIIDYNEIVGVAGMRCLHPSTPVLLPNLTSVPISLLKPGDEVLSTSFKVNGDLERTVVTKVKKVWKSVQQGFFRLTLVSPQFGELKSRIVTIECGTEHLWLTARGLLLATELKLDDKILALYPILKPDQPINTYIRFTLANIELVNLAVTFIDIETENEYFVHGDGLVLHNSGKTVLAALIATYVLHRYLMLPETPAKYLGLMPGATLHMTFVAVDTSQASDTLWQNFRDIYDNCRWFGEYNTYLKEQEKVVGSELVRVMTTFIVYKNKRLSITYAAAKKGLRGRTRFLAAIDELGWFDSSAAAKIASGPETYRALAKSLRTVRSAAEMLRAKGEIDPPDGYMVNISSPQEENDSIMSLLKNPETHRTYKFHYSTWEFNPNVPLESLREEMKTDPHAFWRDYGAIPPASANPAVRQPDRIEDLIDRDLKLVATTQVEVFQQTVGEKIYKYTKRTLLECQVDRRIPRVLTGDAGEQYNSFGLLVAHWDRHQQRGIIDTVIEVEPQVYADGTIASVFFPAAEELINQLIDKLNITHVAFDRWQSTLLVHALIGKGIKAEKISLAEKHFDQFNNNLQNNKWALPPKEPEAMGNNIAGSWSNYPVAHLIRQSKTARKVGRKYIKPPNDNDDLFRCWVLADAMIEKYRIDLSNYALGGHTNVWQSTRRAASIVVNRNDLTSTSMHQLLRERLQQQKTSSVLITRR